MILGIETSCDETSVAIVASGRVVHSCVVASQIKAHRRYGGVVPELASRMHTEALPTVLRQAFREANLDWSAISGIAVTHRPGLESALLIGVTAAKTLAHTLHLPLFGVNHLHGHIVSPVLSQELPFPHLCLVISGGHTQIWHVASFSTMHVVAQTRDDAAGEAFDKVARLLGLGYPGGPRVEASACEATSPTVFPVPLRHDPTSFSFSGLKTAVLMEVRRLGGVEALSPEDIANICQGFQNAVVAHLWDKLAHAISCTMPKAVTVVGGVAANRFLIQAIEKRVLASSFSDVAVMTPQPTWCTDNAAMIAAAAYYMPAQATIQTLEVFPTGC